MTSESERGRGNRPGFAGGAVDNEEINMAKMKQLQLDILENQIAEDEDVVYTFPNHPVYPTKPAIFDDSDMEIVDNA